MVPVDGFCRGKDIVTELNELDVAFFMRLSAWRCNIHAILAMTASDQWLVDWMWLLRAGSEAALQIAVWYDELMVAPRICS
jgi:hypothetical protein